MEISQLAVAIAQWSLVAMVKYGRHHNEKMISTFYEVTLD